MSGPVSSDPNDPNDPNAGGDASHGDRSQPAGPAPGLEYASVGVRLGGYIIDSIIVGAITSGIAGVFGLGWLAWGGMSMMGSDGFDPGRIFPWSGFGLGWLGWLALSTAISGFYFAGLWVRNGATVGQMILDLGVRNAADGTRLSQDQAIRRWAFLTVPVLSSLPALGFVVFIYQVYLLISTNDDPAKQGFHDRQVGSVVVRRAR